MLKYQYHLRGNEQWLSGNCSEFKHFWTDIFVESHLSKVICLKYFNMKKKINLTHSEEWLLCDVIYIIHM